MVAKQALAFLAVFVYATHATHATQAIAFEWKPGFTYHAVAMVFLPSMLLFTTVFPECVTRNYRRSRISCR